MRPYPRCSRRECTSAHLLWQAGQKTPEGYYNVEWMLKRVLARLLCGTCMDARGLDGTALMAGARRSTMDGFAATIVEADKVLGF
jgi:uncharacterized protein involved in oxidation of intracellular sulfur